MVVADKAAYVAPAERGATKEEHRVIVASSADTVFDFPIHVCV